MSAIMLLKLMLSLDISACGQNEQAPPLYYYVSKNNVINVVLWSLDL